MDILVIGSGGREHALCWALQKEQAHQIFCAPGNAGIAEIARCVPLNATDVRALADFAEQEKIALAVVGGEAPLAAGVADEFAARSLAIAGPTKDAARLESSKVFAKAFMVRHGIPTARFRVADSVSEARKILQSGEFRETISGEAGVVIKADGLAGGKGVTVARTRAEAEAAIGRLMEDGEKPGTAGGRVVIEEALAGPEASLLIFTDGRDYQLMPAARDHKRVGEHDTGPNTGGMGAITAPEVLDKEMAKRVVREIVEPTLEGARREGFPFRGILYFGLMLTSEGPCLLEYNVRFGDPEAQAILLRFDGDLAEVFDGVAHKNLAGKSVRWSNDASACIVLAARGYPNEVETGAHIEGLEQARQTSGVQIFHSGTSRTREGIWMTAAGRVLGVAAAHPKLEGALQCCYQAIDHIRWEGMHYRHDIGQFA
ncbi:MAG: phosphoribosylamine--glycine ligase [Pyrinomonadaceae bacterium]|nr:phosphoribosylamine--glycine ligase [Pyrinomonadaceae bacterium]